MKIDFHVHITPPDIITNWQKFAQKESYFSLLCNNKYHKFATAEDVVCMLERDSFDKAVVFGWAFCDIGLCRYVNDYVIEMVKKYPDKLIGFAVVPPQDKEAVKEIERCRIKGLMGVGELFPEGQGFDIENEKEISNFTKICRDLKLPVLLHANEPVGHYYTGKTNVSLKQLETFVKNNPELKIILAHWGGGIFIYESMKEVKESFNNVYYDTSITPFLYDSGIYRAAKAMGLCEKILFGSDFPILPASRYMDVINNESSLSENEKSNILGLNARKLLKI